MTALFVPGDAKALTEYTSYPYWHKGRIIAHQDPLPLEAPSPPARCVIWQRHEVLGPKEDTLPDAPPTQPTEHNHSAVTP